MVAITVVIIKNQTTIDRKRSLKQSTYNIVYIVRFVTDKISTKGC